MELRPIDRTDRAKARLNAALSIYRDTILPEAQNPERQILYWIEHSAERQADQFRCFAIQSGTEVVGYQRRDPQPHSGPFRPPRPGLSEFAEFDRAVPGGHWRKSASLVGRYGEAD